MVKALKPEAAGLVAPDLGLKVLQSQRALEELGQYLY